MKHIDPREFKTRIVMVLISIGLALIVRHFALTNDGPSDRSPDCECMCPDHRVHDDND